MSKLLRKARPALVDQAANIQFVCYSVDKLIVKRELSLDALWELFDPQAVNWIHVCGSYEKETVEQICERFGVHHLLIEDILSADQRSKLDDYKDHLFIIMQILHFNQKQQTVENEQASIVLGKNYVLSFVPQDGAIFDPVMRRLESDKSRMRTLGSDYLCYTLIDCLVDRQFEILEQMDEQLEYLEEDLISHPKNRTVQKIQHIKREILLLHRAVWPAREVMSLFRRIDSSLIQEPTKVYFQDLYDRTIQAIDTIESFRDVSSGMFDIYLSNINLRMNEIMKVLTIVSTIFVPMTFIASIYGMNFDNMPELHTFWGYYVVLSVMLGIASGMLLFFRRKKWI